MKHLIEHDTDVADASSVKLPIYNVNPLKQKLEKKDLEYFFLTMNLCL